MQGWSISLGGGVSTPRAGPCFSPHPHSTSEWSGSVGEKITHRSGEPHTCHTRGDRIADLLGPGGRSKWRKQQGPSHSGYPGSYPFIPKERDGSAFFRHLHSTSGKWRGRVARKSHTETKHICASYTKHSSNLLGPTALSRIRGWWCNKLGRGWLVPRGPASGASPLLHSTPVGPDGWPRSRSSPSLPSASCCAARPSGCSTKCGERFFLSRKCSEPPVFYSTLGLKILRGFYLIFAWIDFIPKIGFLYYIIKNIYIYIYIYYI